MDDLVEFALSGSLISSATAAITGGKAACACTLWGNVSLVIAGSRASSPRKLTQTASPAVRRRLAGDGVGPAAIGPGFLIWKI